MFDEDCMDMDPEELPKRTLTEFAIYNAEVGGRRHVAEWDMYGLAQPMIDSWVRALQLQ